ncbi:MAG: endonuclease/exonuclease/phosphatase family protein [Alistipes sp.]
MKIYRYIVVFSVLLFATLSVATATAQSLNLKCMSWNILSFERPDKSGERAGFPIADFMKLIKESNPDVICFNEFETVTDRMKGVEKLTECGQALGMYPFFGYSYDKSGSNGYYGNGLLSKYPIVNSGSKQMGRYNTDSSAKDIRSVEFIDILVPTSAKPEGRKVRIVATHIETFCDDETQVSQVGEVIDFAVAPAVADNIPVIVMGDMNCGYLSRAIQKFEQTGARLCNNDGTYENMSKLDYIIGFPKNTWSTTDYRVVTKGVTDKYSDHSPIFCTAVLK